MTYFSNDDELDDLLQQARFDRRHQADLARHPDCRDPDHPGCEACEDHADE